MKRESLALERIGYIYQKKADMRFVFFVIVCFSIISCKKESSKFKNEPYIISLERKKYDHCDTCKTIPLIRLPIYFYGTENFIIDKNSNLYYYQLKKHYKEDEFVMICGTGLEDEIKKDSIPIFKDLKPEQIIQIPLNSLDDFIKLNIRKEERNLVKIASQKDTLNSIAYYKLVEALGKNLDFNYPDRDFSAIYNTTQEEDTVLAYLKNKKYYNPNEIKWDLKRIKFFPKPKINQ